MRIPRLFARRAGRCVHVETASASPQSCLLLHLPRPTVAFRLLAGELNITRRYNIKHATRTHANGLRRPHSATPPPPPYVHAHTHTEELISDERHAAQRQ